MVFHRRKLTNPMYPIFRQRRTVRRMRTVVPLARFIATILAVSLLLITTVFGGDRPARAQSFRSPHAMLMAYYSAIGLHNFPQAYSYWISNTPAGTPAAPIQSYPDFASGYLTTDHVDPYLGPLQNPPVANVTGEVGRIPALLIGYHTDGTIETYSGCFIIGSNSSGTFGIAGSRFVQIGQTLPDAAAITQALKSDCYAAASQLPPEIMNPGVFDDGAKTLAVYYNRVNQRNYADAYALWLHPIAGPKPNGAPAVDYRLPYADFVAGYSDTVYVFGYYGSYIENGASAGHSYLDGYLPVVLVGYHADGSLSAASGCYVLGTLSNGGVGAKSLGIVSGIFKVIPLDNSVAGVLDGRSIAADLAVDCTALKLQL